MLNKVTLMGYVNSEIFEHNNSSSCYLYTFKKYKDQDGSFKKKTYTHKILFNHKMFKGLLTKMSRGDRILVEGELDSYEAKDANGNLVTKYSIIANNVVLAGRAEDNNNNSNYSKPNQSNAAPKFEEANSILEDDEIPF